MQPTLSELEALARQAGSILLAVERQGVRVSHKGVIDLVTQADHQSEDYLMGEVRRRYPQHRIVAEESGGLPGSSEQCWHIDPLDGTVNYAHGLPYYSVSIAYAEANQPRLGVVYDPTRDELFSAEAGVGAWLNGQPIRVSDADNLDQALLMTGFPYDIRTNPENNLDLYARFARCSQGVRRFGSAALDLCYLACGRIDGYWEIRLKTHDIAAGALVAREAGATVTKMSGDPDLLTPPCSILSAASLKIHAEMGEVVKHLPQINTDQHR
jgi:myo-inositol-1(or 4)-monophosphatase